MYALSKKQLASLGRGEKLKIALPMPPDAMSAFDNCVFNAAKTLPWACDQITGLGHAAITSADVTTLWLDCTKPKGGLTQFYGSIIPDVSKWSPTALRPITTTVVVVEISPPNPVAEATRIQWPASWTAPSGHVFTSEGGDW